LRCKEGKREKKLLFKRKKGQLCFRGNFSGRKKRHGRWGVKMIIPEKRALTFRGKAPERRTGSCRGGNLYPGKKIRIEHEANVVIEGPQGQEKIIANLHGGSF